MSAPIVALPQRAARVPRRQRPGAWLVSRFVAREAVVRTLVASIGERFGFHSVQVDHDDQDGPVLSFRAHAADLIAELGIGNAMIALSIELIVTIFRK